jgi:hypothetical protein
MQAVEQFLREYEALFRRCGMFIYVAEPGADDGVAMPIDSPENEMETLEEHLDRLFRAERIDR